VFVHVRLSSLGWVVGGVETLVRALLDCIGPSGTLATVASWDDVPFRVDRWAPAWRQAYLEEMPGFDPEHSQANPAYGRFPERLRTWPGARKSGHPDQRVVAVGPLAERLTAGHPLDDSFGPASPFARVAGLDGRVLLLGAPLSSLTLVHHAEAVARATCKRRWTYRLPFATAHGAEWRTLHDIDTDVGPFPYAGVGEVAAAALAAGIGTTGQVAGATCHLLPARKLVRFGVAWLEERFGDRAPTPAPATASGPRSSRAGRAKPPR
jgi:aminoglycoside 3-N-acetyltransferase